MDLSDLLQDEDMPPVVIKPEPAAAAAAAGRGTKRKAAPSRPLLDELSEVDEIKVNRLKQRLQRRRSSDDDEEDAAAEDEESETDSDVPPPPAKKKAKTETKKAAKPKAKRKQKSKAKNAVMKDPEPPMAIQDASLAEFVPQVQPLAKILGMDALATDFPHLSLDAKTADRCKTPGQAEDLTRRAVSAARAAGPKAAARGAGASSGKEEKKEELETDGSAPLDSTSRADTEDKEDKNAAAYDEILDKALAELQVPLWNQLVYGDVRQDADALQTSINAQIRQCAAHPPALSWEYIQSQTLEAGTFPVDKVGERKFTACSRAAENKCFAVQDFGFPVMAMLMPAERDAFAQRGVSPVEPRYCVICFLATCSRYLVAMRLRQQHLADGRVVQPFSVFDGVPGGFWPQLCWKAVQTNKRFDGFVDNFPMYTKRLMFVGAYISPAAAADAKPQRFVNLQHMAWKQSEPPLPRFGERLSTF